VKLAAAIVAALILVGCGDPPPDSGYVREKRFTPAHWEDGYRTVYVPTFECHTVTDSGYDGRISYRQVCGTEMQPRYVYEPEYEWVGDRWFLRLENCDDGHDKCKRGWRAVDHAAYDRYDVGDHYPDAR
jgi:hypothetical protein